MTTTATMTTACCGAEIPEDCRNARCIHGQAVMWNIRDLRWEIPRAGSCRAYRNLGNGAFHKNCRAQGKLPV